MTFTTEHQEQIHANIQKIDAYIKSNILPHITYAYETGLFGPEETWGRSDEHHGQRYYIALNGPYEDKIRFCYGNCRWNADNIALCQPEHAINFLKYWHDAKCYMNTEIKNNVDIVKLINTFEI